jgi:hypothetical protein
MYNSFQAEILISDTDAKTRGKIQAETLQNPANWTKPWQFKKTKHLTFTRGLKHVMIGNENGDDSVSVNT